MPQARVRPNELFNRRSDRAAKEAWSDLRNDQGGSGCRGRDFIVCSRLPVGGPAGQSGSSIRFSPPSGTTGKNEGAALTTFPSGRLTLVERVFPPIVLRSDVAAKRAEGECRVHFDGLIFRPTAETDRHGKCLDAAGRDGCRIKLPAAEGRIDFHQRIDEVGGAAVLDGDLDFIAGSVAAGFHDPLVGDGSIHGATDVAVHDPAQVDDADSILRIRTWDASVVSVVHHNFGRLTGSHRDAVAIRHRCGDGSGYDWSAGGSPTDPGVAVSRPGGIESVARRGD